MKYYWKRAYYVMYIFIFIFAPPLIKGMNIVHLISIFSLFLLVRYHRNDIRQIVHIPELKSFYIKLIYFTIYMVLITTVSATITPGYFGNYLVNLYRMFLILFSITICIIYLVIAFKNDGIDFWEALKFIVISGCVQLCFSLLMLFFPEVKYVLVDFILKNTIGSGVDGIPSWEYARRYFAFSDNMVDMLGYGTGLIAIFPLLLGMKKNEKYFFLSPFLLLVPMLNAVTGIVIYIIGVIIVIPEIIRTYKSKFFKALLFVFLIIGIGLFLVYKYSPYSLEWVTREISTLFLINKDAATQVTSIGNLFRDKSFKLPDKIVNILFGTGHTVYSLSGFEHSDVGYTNNIWLVGILGSLFLYSTFAKFFIDAYQNHKDKAGKILILFIAVSFFIFEVKGGGVTYQPAMVLTLLISTWSITLKVQ